MTDPTFWRQKWSMNDIGFHQEAPHEQLAKRFPVRAGESVLVPLCGKSLDLLWLRDQGMKVIGIELSELAVRAFFVENRLPFTERREGPNLCFESDRLTIWCADLFTLAPALWADCTTIFDRAALIALPPEVRLRYVAHLLSGALPERIFVISLEYQSPVTIGPPFSVPPAEIETLFGRHYRVKLLESDSDDPAENRPPKFANSPRTEHTLLLVRI